MPTARGTDVSMLLQPYKGRYPKGLKELGRRGARDTGVWRLALEAALCRNC